MNPVQQYLFPEMAQDLTEARARLVKFRDEAENHRLFIGSVAARILNADQGGLVLVACSPAVQQDKVVSDLLRHLRIAPDSAESALCFSAPPETTTALEQVKLLHERYRVAANQLPLAYKNSALYSRRRGMAPVRQSEVEAIAEMLELRPLRLTCLTQAQHLVTPTGSAVDRTRLLQHVDDIARRSGVRHVAFGDRALLCATAKHARGRFPIVVQPMYDPENDSEVARFRAIVDHCDTVLKDCSKFKLADQATRLMKTVAGDPCRLARWVSDAVCHATALGHQAVHWSHICATQPSRAEITAAHRELALFCEFQTGDDLCIGTDEPDEEKRGRGGRSVGRKPCRDAVPPAAAA